MSGAGGAEWKAFLARHPAVVKRRVRKGIPNALRSLAWQLLSGGRDLLLQNEGESCLRLAQLCAYASFPRSIGPLGPDFGLDNTA